MEELSSSAAVSSSSEQEQQQQQQHKKGSRSVEMSRSHPDHVENTHASKPENATRTEDDGVDDEWRARCR